ncbi:oxidoreductase [Corynebacterium epidermidicanis]|uniref:NADH:flavin oxidoreductase n=1 Tax=Corynebacterium epidermidicanis TaxID=1050174 RepID=A0A0G3GXY7_9CORY|nr:12-oxophytodienoate reductase [Corynebacterium epidermidicanis]AKK03682.1 NADH:flavin oxidoreductase [Corynebacterium epidermidicanis]
MTSLFSSLAVGRLQLKNRVVQGPMGRLRADHDGNPTEIMTQYFAERAGMGLIVTDGTSPTREGRVHAYQPGLFDDSHIPGWAAIADAVHQAGGTVVAQLMHAGWNTHSGITGFPVEAPSAVDHEGWAHDAQGNRLPFETPTPLDEGGLDRVIEGFRGAARRAIEAGLDGVELHAANGYLLHSFLSPNSNQRTDAFGGSPAKRAAFPLAVARAVAEEVGADRVGIRVSPGVPVQGVVESDPEDMLATYSALIDGLNELGVAYLSVLHYDVRGELVATLRSRFAGAFFLNNAAGPETPMGLAEATEIVDEQLADAAVVARLALANPDLVARWRAGAELNEPQPATFYAGGARGYIDYPALESEA